MHLEGCQQWPYSYFVAFACEVRARQNIIWKLRFVFVVVVCFANVVRTKPSIQRWAQGNTYAHTSLHQRRLTREALGGAASQGSHFDKKQKIDDSARAAVAACDVLAELQLFLGSCLARSSSK